MVESNPEGRDVNPDMVEAPAPPRLGQREGVWLDLVSEMAAGRQDALGRLYDETSGVTYALALRILRNREDAEEVVLDAYSRAWRLAGGFDKSRGSVLTWLIMMTRSIAIDKVRSRSVRSDRTEPLDEPHHHAASQDADPEVEALFQEQRERVQAALAELPTEQRQTIELAFFGGYSHSELAEMMGVPLGTVKTRVRLGLARLRGHLEDFA